MRGVVNIRRRDTLMELTRKLAEARVGALIVMDDADVMVGVISERDIVRALSTTGEAALTDAVEKHMTTQVETATPTDDSEAILERMTSGRFRHMPVLEDGRLIGVVSIGDIVKARIELLEREKDAMEAFIQR